MKSRILLLISFIIVLISAQLSAQNTDDKKTVNNKAVKQKAVTEKSEGKYKTTSASGDSISFRDGDGNTLIKITDEGTTGSITIPPAGSTPSTTSNKLYNVGSTLYFNGSSLGSGGGASSINDLSDAKTDETSVFLGSGAGASDDGSNYNTAIGINALHSNTTGNYNIANGNSALYLNTTGSNNTVNGYQALYSNTTANDNTAIGYQALYNNTGYFNTANGFEALYNNTTGIDNTANGLQALYNNTTGGGNTAMGYGALPNNTTGSNNTANGFSALGFNNSGSYNTAVGEDAFFYNHSGSYNTAIGFFTGPASINANLNNTTALGNGAQVSFDNEVRIGNSSVTSIGGKVSWTTVSDIRFKKNIKEDVSGLDFIMGLKPITYNLDVNAMAEKLGEDIRIDKNGNRIKIQPSAEVLAAREKKSMLRQSGFSAQAVEALAIKLGYSFGGVDKPENENGLYGLRYSEFVVPLVKAVQEQQKDIVDERKTMEDAKKTIENQQQEIMELKEEILRIEKGLKPKVLAEGSN